VPPSTRQRLIDAALVRFYADGFRNVGLDQVLRDVGISKTAFYKHFESKDDLMLAALESQNQWIQERFRAAAKAQAGPDPVDQLRALFDVVEDIVESAQFQGCIFVNAALEFPLAHDPAHRAAAQNKRAIEALVAELCAEAGAPDPRAMAQELCLLMEGAYVTRQVTGGQETIGVARRVAERVLQSHLGCRERQAPR
jgi:AcrR family transcriptional regulator